MEWVDGGSDSQGKEAEFGRSGHGLPSLARQQSDWVTYLYIYI